MLESMLDLWDWYQHAVGDLVELVGKGGLIALVVLAAVLVVEHSPFGLIAPGPTCLVLLGFVAVDRPDGWVLATPAVAVAFILAADYYLLYRAAGSWLVRLAERFRLFRGADARRSLGDRRRRYIMAAGYQLSGWTRHHIPIWAAVSSDISPVEWVTRYALPGTLIQVGVMFGGAAAGAKAGMSYGATLALLMAVGNVTAGVFGVMYVPKWLRAWWRRRGGP